MLTQHCPGDKIEKNEIGGECSACGGRGGAYTGFWWGKYEGKRPLGRPRRRWEVNIKMDLHEVGCGALVNAVLNLRVYKMRGIS